MTLQEQQNAALPIIYQDHHLLIVNKAAGVVIHPTYKHADGTMWDALLAYTQQQGSDDWLPPELTDKPAWARAPEHIRAMLREQQRERQWKEEGLLERPGLMHRLDKDTSGIVVIARTARCRHHLARQFQERTIDKRYLAVVSRGAPDWTKPRTSFEATRYAKDGSKMPLADPVDVFGLEGETLLLDGELGRDPDDRRRCIVGPGGQEARTMIEVLAINKMFALIEARPVTGRTHQIRAHLAALGYPVVGDQTYALPAQEDTGRATLKRQFLHAFRVEFSTYPENTRRSFIAPLPDDLVTWLERYFPEGLDSVHAATALSA